jgi:metallo-beta-lactamase family protein
VFIVHGEDEAKYDFAKEVQETLGLECIVPEYNQVYEIKGKQIEEVREPRITAESPVTEERIAELLKGLEELKELFEHTLKQIEGRVSNDQNDPLTMVKYNQINNILLHLESDFVDLSMLSGK